MQISINGGISDVQCPPHLARIKAFSNPETSIELQTDFIKGIEGPSDHRALYIDRTIVYRLTELILNSY